MRRWFWLVTALLLVGCKSHPLGPYVTPRVVGRVVAADSSQPLAHVRVTRGKLDRAPLAGWTPKGGELLVQKPPALTDAEGRFVLGSERVLSLVRGFGWNEVQLSFQRPGYQPFQTNYSGMLATNTDAGEPLLDVGTVRLQPLMAPAANSTERPVVGAH